MLRDWREQRRLSQLALSAATGVSTRHLSCVETGRATPSRELVLHLAEELDVPLRDRNHLLLAAGYAPTYRERQLSDPELRPATDVLAAVVQRSDPNPTVVVDRYWNLVMANAAAFWMCGSVVPELLEPPINVARLSVHPHGLAPHVRNFEEYATHLMARIRRDAAVTRDATLGRLVDEMEELCATHSLRSAVPRRANVGAPFAISLQIQVDGFELALFTTIATFGTPTDITLAELSIETFYPADDDTAAVLATRPWA